MLLKITLAVIALTLFAVARKAKPAENQGGSNVFPGMEWNETKEKLVIATYNIQTGKSLEGKRDISRSAQIIKQADIVGVQEVYAASWLNKLGLGRSQTEEISDEGRFATVFSATRRRWFREHRGNALLSRLPIKSWQVTMLPDFTGKSYRNMTVAKLDFKGEELCIINTHLHTKKGRQEQLKVVLDEFSKYERAILLGDFNSKIEEPLLKEALKDPNVKDAIGQGLSGNDVNNVDRIDWVLMKGVKLLDVMTINKGISDHPYYQITIE